MSKTSMRRVRRAIVEMSESSDPNDMALCNLLATVLTVWEDGKAERLLRKIRLLENREAFMSGELSSASMN